MLRAAELEGSSDTPRLDTELLLCKVLDWDRARLLAWPEQRLTQAQQKRFSELFAERKRGCPVAHLVGSRQFWSLDLHVTPDTLIPRPDTELLVECALALQLPDDAHVADLGTGSGAIALALAAERPAWQVIGLEQSPAAFEVAVRNRDRLGLEQVALVRQSWQDFVPQAALDLIVSNPPYVEEDSAWLREGDVRFEPREALVAGQDGLDAIRDLVPRAAAWLHPGGWLVLEHGFAQAERVRDLLSQSRFTNVASRQDLAGHERISFGQVART